MSLRPRLRLCSPLAARRHERGGARPPDLAGRWRRCGSGGGSGCGSGCLTACTSRALGTGSRSLKLSGEGCNDSPLKLGALAGSTLVSRASMSYEFGDFGEEDESVTGLKAASEKKKGRSRRSRKKKKQEVLEAGDNPMADSSDEGEPEQTEQPTEAPAGSRKKKKKKKKNKKQQVEASHGDVGMSFGSDEEDEEGISGLPAADKKGKKEKKKKVKKGTVLEAGENPMAESSEEVQRERLCLQETMHSGVPRALIGSEMTNSLIVVVVVLL